MKREGLGKIVYTAFLFSFISSFIVTGLLFWFVCKIPVDELTKMLVSLWSHPIAICGAMFLEIFLLLFVIEIFRIIFESGTKSKGKTAAASSSSSKKSTKKKGK